MQRRSGRECLSGKIGNGGTTDWSEMGTFTTLAGIDLTVTGYGESTESDHWAFIASPVAEALTPSNVTNLMATPTTDYDLYRFNQSAANGKEWENYKATTSTNHADFTTLVNGQGYLYATKETKTLVFAGDITSTTTPVEVPLAYSTDNTDVSMRGWNLVGNPFAVEAYVNRPFYQMNEAGTGIEPIDTYNNYTTPISIPPCTGIMVQAGNENDTVVFSTSPSFTAPYNGGLSVTLTQVVEPVETPANKGNVSKGDGPSTGSGTFAYIDANGNIIITDEDACNASLQVVDVMGRVIRCRDAVTASLPTTGMAPGVYILRLINGDSVRTQKIVVK